MSRALESSWKDFEHIFIGVPGGFFVVSWKVNLAGALEAIQATEAF